MRLAAFCLTFIVFAGSAAAAPGAAEKAAIEKAYAARLDAQTQADVSQRIAARWAALANDPAAPAIGNANADVTIVEFFDYTCPYCKAVEPRLEALLKADPKVKLVLREFCLKTMNCSPAGAPDTEESREANRTQASTVRLVGLRAGASSI